MIIQHYTTKNLIIMADSFSQVYLHFVIAVKGRQNLLQKPWREEVFKYMSGIVTAKKEKSIIINGVADHVHIFVGFNTPMDYSYLIRDIKNNTTNFINEKKFLRTKFQWQEGYGVFSYSHSSINNVYNYILNQEAHHHKKTFREEYIEFLRKFEIEYDEKYLFEWYD